MIPVFSQNDLQFFPTSEEFAALNRGKMWIKILTLCPLWHHDKMQFVRLEILPGRLFDKSICDICGREAFCRPGF